MTGTSRTLLLSQGDGDEFFVEAAGEVALECPRGFAGSLVIADAAVEKGASLLVVDCAAKSAESNKQYQRPRVAAWALTSAGDLNAYSNPLYP